MQLDPIRSTSYSNVHCGSAVPFARSASGPTSFCAPSVCIPKFSGGLAVWRLIYKKQKNFSYIPWYWISIFNYFSQLRSLAIRKKEIKTWMLCLVSPRMHASQPTNFIHYFNLPVGRPWTRSATVWDNLLSLTQFTWCAPPTKYSDFF